MNSNEVVFFSQFFSEKGYGASKVSHFNAFFLKSLFKVVTVSWAKKSVADLNFNSNSGILNRGLLLFMGFSGNLTVSIFFSIIRTLPSLDRKKHVIWLDSSLLGHLTFFFYLLGFKTIVFFHNCEVDLIETDCQSFLCRVRNNSIKMSERLSINYAYKIISISLNDSERIKEYYNRKVDLVFPPLPDGLVKCFNYPEKTIGFLGSDWHPNEYALNYILDLATELPDYRFYIGGQICKRAKRAIPNNVELLGYLDDIEIFYNKVHTILSPVVFGGGIKIKVLEAIQHGKLIIGSMHSIKGFEAFNGICYFTANEKEDYINLIRKYTGVKQVEYSEITKTLILMKVNMSKHLNDLYQQLKSE